jgi:hypothetical protein
MSAPLGRARPAARRHAAAGVIAGDVIAMGLPAPGRWEHRRIALSIPRDDVLCFDEFPRVEQVVTLLPEAGAR